MIRHNNIPNHTTRNSTATYCRSGLARTTTLNSAATDSDQTSIDPPCAGESSVFLQSLRNLHRTTSGTTTVEFALTIPFLLFITLLLIQTTLVTSAHLMVRFAAFTATRSAIVTIPAYFSADEPANEIYYPGEVTLDSPADFTGKYNYIREAAVYALAPITSADDSASSSTVYPLHPWITKRLEDKLQYAANNTAVNIYTTNLNVDANPPEAINEELSELPLTLLSNTAVGPKDAITVKVSHKFKLTMPLVKFIFESKDENGYVIYDGIRILSSQFTLNNEGITNLLPPIPKQTNALPDEPNTRPRVPPLYGQ